MSTKDVPLSLVDANPFRHMDRYPISEDKINQLIGSMERTGFWDNVVARETEQGRYELAYGHHRRIAFERKYGKKAHISLILRDLDDETMIRMMADENMQEFGTSATVEQETIRAVVLAYANEQIDLPFEGKNPKQFRNAPSFKPVGEKFNGLKFPKPYNAESIAKFLGWMSGDQVSPRVRNALLALEAIEEELVDDEDMEGLSSAQAKEVVRGAKKIVEYAKTEASTMGPKQAQAHQSKAKETANKAVKEVVREVKKDKKSGGIGVREVQQKMEKVREDRATGKPVKGKKPFSMAKVREMLSHRN